MQVVSLFQLWLGFWKLLTNAKLEANKNLTLIVVLVTCWLVLQAHLELQEMLCQMPLSQKIANLNPTFTHGHTYMPWEISAGRHFNNMNF